jgi:hypothetical protein
MRPYPAGFSIRRWTPSSTLLGVHLKILFVFVLRLGIYFRFGPRQVPLPALAM